MPDAFFNGLEGVARILPIAPAAYVASILIPRVSGKRTLAKLNGLKLVITIAIGSTLALAITSSTLSLVDGLAALALLLPMQFIFTYASVRWPGVNEGIKAEATHLLRNGELLPKAMWRERITADEIEAAIRQLYGRGVADTEAVFLEADGFLALVPSA